MSLMIKNAHAILSGLPGEAARLAGPDIRIRDGKIAAIGSLTPLPEERQIDARDCVIYPAWVNTHHHLFQSLLKGEPQGAEPEPDGLAERYAVPLSRGFR
ncbi:hypothetical protein LNP26_23315 [Klebsiella variicola subsp. variicola]|nr:hypothetical protein [Klebsiella variicola subsp. variicola]